MNGNDSDSSNSLGLALSSEGFFAIENSFPKATTKGRPAVGSSLGKLRFRYLGVQGFLGLGFRGSGFRGSGV